MDIQAQIDEIILQRIDKKKLASELGFFSKPVRIISEDGKSYIIKLYQPLKSEKKCRNIMAQHDAYMDDLKKAGIQIPETQIQLKKINNRYQLIIIQDAFDENELARGQLQNCTENDFLKLMELILDDALKFCRNKPDKINIGFHPTLRNYAIINRQLFYFDTFPPMLMQQRELNKLIIAMTPLKINIRFLIPPAFINRVSNEYYQADKMLIGIIGSCCRLRPDLIKPVLEFSRNYISQTEALNKTEKEIILKEIENPPRLPGIWLAFRKFFGKTGKPNVD